VTAHPDEVERLLQSGHWLQSRQPASRFAVASYRVAGQADAAAAPYYRAHFQRTVAGPWLLARRVKRRPRPEVRARHAPGFVARWLWVRRRELRFALPLLLRWWFAATVLARRARRVLAADASRWSRRELSKTLRRQLGDHQAVRRLHAALWYPVELLDDAGAFSTAFGLPRPALAMPRWRIAREAGGAAVVLGIRAAHHGVHPDWQALTRSQRQTVMRHLCRHPYAFESSEEVQDIAAWQSHVERPERWWATQAHALDDELAAANARPAPGASAGTCPAPMVRLCAWLLRGVVGWFAPLKDDRVEFLALSSAAVRGVMLELRQRADPRGEADHDWIFELEPDELLDMAATLPRHSRHWTALGFRRLRARRATQPRPQTPPARRSAPSSPLTGRPLACGIAMGTARRVHDVADGLRRMRSGDVLLADELRPSLTQLAQRAGALVLRRGSPLCHGALIARERGIPAVALGDAHDSLPDGVTLAIDGSTGLIRVVAS